MEILIPSTSSKQARFMAAIAKDKNFADKAGVSQAVGKEFHDADKGKKKSKFDILYKKGK